MCVFACPILSLSLPSNLDLFTHLSQWLILFKYFLQLCDLRPSGTVFHASLRKEPHWFSIMSLVCVCVCVWGGGGGGVGSVHFRGLALNGKEVK